MPSVDLSNYHLTFDDEFNSLSASPNGSGTTWETKYWWGARSLGTNDYYLDPSVGGLGETPYSIVNGALVIHAQPTTPELQAAGVTQTFTTGQIDTHNSFSQEYGYFEMRAQVSDAYGTNNAFWLMPMSGPWPPEIDVTEVLGRDPSTDFMTNHTDSTNPTSYGGTATGIDLSQAFHTYGLMWTPTTLTFYLDGMARYTTATQPDEHQPMYMLATLGVGGSWPGNPDPTNYSADMKIDYIRAYSSDTAISAVSLQTISSPDGVDTTPYGATTADGVLQPGGTTPTPTPTPTPAPTPTGLTVRVSEDAWRGDAKFNIFVDGQQIGGTQTATANHSAGEWQDITLTGTFDSGPHVIDINYINDAHKGGRHGGDRNLYVESVMINGEIVTHATSDAASNGMTTTDGSTILAVNGTAEFDSHGTSSTGTNTSTSSALYVVVSEDAYQGDAQFTVSVDGHQVGGTYTATASHAAGQWQAIDIGGTYSSGLHDVVVTFVNDLYGGTATTDRNLYVQSVTINGETISQGTVPTSNTAHPADGSVELGANGSVTYSSTGTATTATSASTTTPPSTIVLHVAEDAYQGDAQFTVLIDGHQIDGTYTATASHSVGQWQDITLTGDFGSTGPGKVDIQFINDAWGGTAATDRNLYVQSIDVNGQHFGTNTATNNAANGETTTDGSFILAINGTVEFNVNHTAAPTDWHLA